MRKTPPTPDMQNGPEVAPASKDFEAVIPAATNRKGEPMFSSDYIPARLRYQGPRDIGATALLTVSLFALAPAALALADLLVGGAS